VNRHIDTVRALVGTFTAVLAAAHCAQAWSQASAKTPALADAARACAALAQQSGTALGEPTARILTANLNPRSASKPDPAAPPWAGPLPPMPEHCEVLGVMRERTGSDGQKYAVKFHMRLPSDWNGKFLFQGGGGTNGVLGAANGGLQPGMPTGLEQGFAVVSTDTGHDNVLNGNPAKQGQVAFGHDYQARVEYAEKALDSVATTAKRIVRIYYQRPASHSFFAGCSNGGREGMVFAQRFPEQFDGIWAGSPAFAVPKAAVAEAWDTQTFATLAAAEGFRQSDGLPDIAKAFSDADLRIVAEAVTKACDAADGAVDGMVQNLSQCTTARVRPLLDASTCTGAKGPTCLSREQVEALVRSLGGPHDAKGHALYADWPWDVGIADTGWRIWKLGIPGAMGAINVLLGSPALSGLFVTPPTDVADTPQANLRYQLEFNFDNDAPKIFGKNAQFPRSGWDLVGAQSTNLERFRQHGGKLIVSHGGSDPIFSLNDTLAWWRRLDAENHGTASDFARVYAVPGMNHCGGGPATDQFDALAAVVDWVEHGVAPDSIPARAGPMTPWPGRTRPLCAFPKIARYRSGDLNQAASFACEAGG
jgi:hypothetical protein